MDGKAWLLAVAVLFTGCASVHWVRTPTGPPVPDTYAAQWQAAATVAGDYDQLTKPATRLAVAKRGVVLARRARELNPAGVEGHYYYALNVGYLADADNAYGLDAVVEMEAALKRVIELDEQFDRAGGLRLLGILHLRTPAPPVSIGSARKGLRCLQRAVELFPADPENLLYLAEALRDNGRTDEALAVLGKIALGEPWQSKARLLRESLKQP
jgi:tetratricopeptide (TPR) repeat protein